jgi:hypothetical protein
MRVTRLLFVVTALAATGCPRSADDDNDDGSGDDAGEGEGEAGEGEGEGEAGEGALRVEVDGVLVDAIDFGAIAAAVPGQTGASREREVTLLPVDPSRSVALFTDPPVLVGGLDGGSWTVVDQPGSAVRPGGTSFAVRFAPTSVGDLEGALILATGTRADERLVIALRGEGTGPARSAGLLVSVYEGVFDVLPDFATLTPAATTVQATATLPPEREDTDGFALLLRGAIDVPTAGAWTFFATSDDGSQVLVDGALVVDNDGLHGPVERSGTAELTAGLHSLEVRFFEKAGGESLVVEWSGPGRNREELPASALFTAP